MNADDMVRLNVNLNRETADTLAAIAEERGISATEAVRRAITVYAYIVAEVAKGRKVQTQDHNGRHIKELILL